MPRGFIGPSVSGLANAPSRIASVTFTFADADHRDSIEMTRSFFLLSFFLLFYTFRSSRRSSKRMRIAMFVNLHGARLSNELAEDIGEMRSDARLIALLSMCEEKRKRGKEREELYGRVGSK